MLGRRTRGCDILLRIAAPEEKDRAGVDMDALGSSSSDADPNCRILTVDCDNHIGSALHYYTSILVRMHGCSI